MLVAHEPTFFTHWDLDETKADYFSATPAAREAFLKTRDEKRSWLEKSGLAIIRCHDVLDALPEWGMPFSLGKCLGFSDSDRIRETQYYHVYRLSEETTALAYTQKLAETLAPLGQTHVPFFGDQTKPIKTVGLGTGCFCDPLQFMEMQPDYFIAIDDTIRNWIQGAWANDSGTPLAVINHGTSEEWGTRVLSERIQTQFADLVVQHIPQGSAYQLIGR